MANTPVVFPRDGQGFRAEVKLGDDIHLVFMATYSALGPAATVYDAKLKKWWQAGEWAEDIEEAKQKAEARRSPMVQIRRSQGTIPQPRMDCNRVRQHRPRSYIFVCSAQ
jgi:hypothetical protein